MRLGTKNNLKQWIENSQIVQEAPEEAQWLKVLMRIQVHIHQNIDGILKIKTLMNLNLQ